MLFYAALSDSVVVVALAAYSNEMCRLLIFGIKIAQREGGWLFVGK